MVIVRRAKPEDQIEIQRLLREANLDDDGLDEHLEHFFVVEISLDQEEDSQMVGTAGMEVYGSYALLRSLVIARASWNAKVSWQLIQILLSYAEHLQVEEVYLFAGGSVDWFQQLGFEKIPLADLPEKIRELHHVDKLIHKGTPLVFRPRAELYH